ncbi:ABC transporter ATP-binding protein [Xylophilus sp.]|uniref:ABC transporter ATP-binding protein n=1 Tax=Xylophilus sp. TaxID=2653893 RepID=UPI0013B8BB59|nr:ABC transporter ATP-binding protein [Xylophilus sp.]KAF1046644.1 MAG: putative multidrug export ATP-binding/permease protein [Xylophilus sp.]
MSAAQPAQQDALNIHALGGLDLRAMPRVLGRLARLGLRHRWLSLGAIGCALGAAVFNLVLPRLLGRAVDEAHRLLASGANDAARRALWATAALIVGAAVLRGVLTGLQGYFGEWIAHRTGHDLRLAFFDKLQRLSPAFHDANHSGDLITRGMLDLEGVRAFLESALLRVVALALLLGLGVWRLVGMDPVLGLLALSFVPFVIVRAARMGVLLRLSWQRLQQLMSDLTLGMEENLQGQRVVRAFASRDKELARYDAVADRALDLSNRRITLRMSAMSQMNLAFYTAMGLVLWFGGRRVAAGQITVGMLGECLAFMTLLQMPVRQVGMIVNASARATGAGARLFAVLDAVPDIADAPDAKPLAVTEGVLRFEDVSFAYGPPAVGRQLSHVSFTLRPGQVLGVVGAPGAGKSTLAQLVPRLRDASAGRITIDGQDIRTVTLDSLRSAVVLVQQEAFLFDTSAHDNIVYSEPDSPADVSEQAAVTAQLHEQLLLLPQGYGSRVGERGGALSGGQRQRMTIARALAAKPRVLVLDDASSAVDNITERRLRGALQDALQHAAVIIVAHRLAALQHADEILVLEDGRVAERGTHDALVAQGGAYAALWELQNRSGDHAEAANDAKGIAVAKKEARP